MKILCVCLSTTIQRTLWFENFSINQLNRTKIWREDASGKALNASRVLNQLETGCSLVLCPVGNANAEYFMKLVARDEDLQVHPVYVDGNTRECWTLLDGEKTATTEVVADETQDPYKLAGAEAEIELLNSVKEYMRTCDALLFAGSRPVQWSANLCARICEIALKEGKMVLADFWGKDLLDTLNMCIPQIIKINHEEYSKTFSDHLLSKEELIESVKAKSAAFHNCIVITNGEDDIIAGADGTIHQLSTEKLRPVNTTACGDSFAAGLLYEYLTTHDFTAALNKAVWCATRNAQSVVPGSIR
ncbi:MAG: hypothetical protein IJS09_09520 [Treponema sp.]|nr:hypothetical protein [Treponema sp.]